MFEISLSATICKNKDKGIATFLIDEPFDDLLRKFAVQHKLKPGIKVRLILQQYSGDRSEEAANLFHAIRDRLADAQEGGHASAEYKDHFKQCLKFDFGVKKELLPGQWWLKSTTRYTTREMYYLIQGALDRCLEEKVFVEDLLEEYGQWQKAAQI